MSKTVLFVPFLGQSNAAFMGFKTDGIYPIDDDETGASVMNDTLKSLTQNHYDSYKYMVTTAEPGSTVNAHYSDGYTPKVGSKVWWDPSPLDGVSYAGAALDDAIIQITDRLDVISNSGDHVVMPVVWMQGEDELLRLGHDDYVSGGTDNTSGAELYKQNTLSVLNHIQDYLSSYAEQAGIFVDIQFHLGQTGRRQEIELVRTNTTEDILAYKNGLEIIRQAQIELAEDHDFIELSVDYRYIEMRRDHILTGATAHEGDAAHYSAEGYEDAGQRFANDIAENLGFQSDSSITQSINVASSGNDVLFALSDDGEIIEGISGHDVITGGDGDDVLRGQGGHDLLIGEAGDDKLYGGIGNDFLSGGSGNDELFGGNGDDTALFYGDEADYSFSFSGGHEDYTLTHKVSNEATRLKDIENVEFANSVEVSSQDLHERYMPVVMEYGTTQAGNSLQTVSFDHDFINPNVFLTMNTQNETDLATARVTSVTGNGFSFYAEEPDSMDQDPNNGDHVLETFSYIVVEQGSWTLSDGTKIEAGSLQSGNLSKTAWDVVDFDTDFTSRPSIFSQVQTERGDDWVVVRHNDADSDGFELALQEQEEKHVGDDDKHNLEDIGWLAIEQKSGTIDGDLAYFSESFTDVDNVEQILSFDNGFDDIPVLLASLSSYSGTQTAAVRVTDLQNDGVEVKIQEDTSFDNEVVHNNETVDILVLDFDSTQEQPHVIMGYETI